MNIDLRQLSSAGTGEIPFSQTIELKQEKLYGAYPFQSPVSMIGTVENRFGVLHLRGTVKTIYHTSCARCLKPLDILLTAEADVILSDHETDDEQEDVYVLTGDEVDPADILVPALILQVEMTYLCKSDCLGLCPHCGVDRNVTQCDCESKQTDPRFDVLRALLEKK